MLDHVHPTRKGNLILAETVFDAILRHNLIEDGPRITRFSDGFHSSSSGKIRYDESLDFSMQVELIEVFHMMHQYESAIRKVESLLEKPGALESLDEHQLRIVRGTRDVFTDAVELKQREILGLPVDPALQKLLNMRITEFFRHNIDGYETFQRKVGTGNNVD